MDRGHSRRAASSPAVTGIMHGSPLSDDSSLNSDLGTLTNNASNRVLSYPWSKPLNSGLFNQCILALYSLARDPSPRIAGLVKQILAVIGIDRVVSTLQFSGRSDQLVDPKALVPVYNYVGLARSSSWFDMNAGMRRVFSGPSLPKSLDLGLADPLLGSGESSSISEHGLLPQSAIYDWSCRHFARPLLTTTDDDEELMARREEGEKFALDYITKWQHSSASKFNMQILDSKLETGTKTALMEPFSPIVIAADDIERIRIWNYEEAVVLNSFDNHNFSQKGVSKLCLVNELDDSLLLVASCDGNVRIWKDYSLNDEQKLVTAFSSIQGHRPGVRHTNSVVDWQQQSGYLYASGEISSIMLWDVDKEQLVKSIPSSSECSISALSASQVHGGQVAAGFVDGSIALYDIRTPEMIVCSAQPHTQEVERVVGISFQPGLDSLKIVSASQAGDIQFLDIRNYSDPYLTIDTDGGSLTALAVHQHAPIIAAGSAKNLIKIFNLEGKELGRKTFMPQKIGSISCLAFHPYEPMLAAGNTDAGLSIYTD
ncbi:hypothetical protein L1049_013726 [Liquidambar formosana]|uniref:Uncharacterized protein n=1 Tax=Liquidambar formosana TaxID=63359 RepID=A0AAP0RKS8_LIQFO